METSSQAVQILKMAILLERRGKAFYSQVAGQTKSPAVKQIFEMLAEEENAHIGFLSRQFAHYDKTNVFLDVDIADDAPDAQAVLKLAENLKSEISAASYEAAAISAAIDFENKAIELYSKRAEEAVDQNEKAVYQMLADWEKKHHHLLYKMGEDLKEDIWNDNNFWPF
ncbi:hypothetical protein MASR2M12_10800 [Bacteroidales bacterium]